MTESSELQVVPYVDIYKAREAWIQHLEREYSPLTAEAYGRSLNHFLTWCDEQEPPLEIPLCSPKEIRAWRDAMKENYSPSTVSLRISGVRSFFQYAIERGAPSVDPTRDVKVRGGSRSGARRHKRDELTDDELLAVLATCDGGTFNLRKPYDYRDRAILTLMAYCGLRTIEIHRANIGDLETKDGRRILWVWGKGRVEPDDFVVLPAPAEQALRDWIAERPIEGGPIFISLARPTYGRRLGLRSLRKIIRTRFQKCGIRSSRKTAHSLRHSAISRAIRGGASPLQVQAMARHSDVKTTLSYYHEKNRIENPAEDLISYGEEPEDPQT